MTNVQQQIRLLIVCRDQFGYHTDTLMYAQHLDVRFKTTYVCIDKGRPKVEVEGVKVIYTQSRLIPGKVGRFVGFIASAIQERKLHDVYFIKEFSGSFLLRAFIPSRRSILDIRTLSVQTSRRRQLIENALIRFDMLFYKFITVVSAELAVKVKRPAAIEIGLGCNPPSDFHSSVAFAPRAPIEIVYVGTLTDRGLDTVIEGLARWSNSYKGGDVQLTFVGEGFNGERKALESLAEDLGIRPMVEFTGYLSGEALNNILQRATYGLVHVPDEPRYAVQPSTKLFEYWAWGLPILGTDYPMNRKYVKSGFGLLYSDNADGFEGALHAVVSGISNISSKEIHEYSTRFSWKKVVELQLVPVLNRLFDVP